jgi:hypothetical protein
MTTPRRRAAWAACAALGAIASLIALDPVLSGDNYCGRLYFDTQWNPACRTTMAIRAGWFLALAGATVVLAVGLVASARRPGMPAVAAFAAIAVIGVLVGFNRLLQPLAVSLPVRTQFCGSVLNRHESPFDRSYNRACDDLLGPHKRAAALAFAFAALSGAGAMVIDRTARTVRPPPRSTGAPATP